MVEVQTGQLADTALPALLAQLYASRHSGAVQLWFPDAEGALTLRAQVYLRAGYPVDALVADSSDRLGVVLLENGLLDRERYLRAQTLHPTAGKRIGELMLGARLLDRRALVEGLRTQVRRRLQGLFVPQQGAFQVLAGAHGRGSSEGESLASDPRRVIYFATRRHYSPAQLHAGITALRGFDVQLSPPEAAEALRWLPASESRMAQVLLRGAWSIDALVTSAIVHPQAALAFLYTFSLTQSLQLLSAGTAPRRPLTGDLSALPLAPVYQPSDEALPPDQSPAKALGRPVLLRSGADLPPSMPGAAALARKQSLVAIEGTHPPQKAPAPAEPAPEAPTAAPEVPEASSWRPPPLRTSLPTLRLPAAATPTPAVSAPRSASGVHHTTTPPSSRSSQRGGGPGRPQGAGEPPAQGKGKPPAKPPMPER